MSQHGQEDAHRTIERVARESFGRLVAYMSSHTRDLASAEDAIGDALLAALTAGRAAAFHKILRRGS